MQTFGIENHGIKNPLKVERNLSPALLTEEALKTEPARLMDTGALLVETGAYTGRSPKDRFIVDEKGVSEKIGWGRTKSSRKTSSSSSIKRLASTSAAKTSIYSTDLPAQTPNTAFRYALSTSMRPKTCS